MDIFVKSPEEYKREINPIIEYRKQTAFYLSKVKDIDIYTATKHIDKLITEKQITFNDPELVYYERKDNGDRDINKTTLMHYIKDTVVNNYNIAPTFTNYLPESVNKSPISSFVDINVKNRSIAKEAGFKAKILNDNITFTFMNNEQNNLKLYNNSLSGAFGAKGSVFYNPTAHSTLTSITRIETSLANALNEKIISGNRHYRNPKVTLNNINFLAYIAKKDMIESTIDKYHLRYPTINEVIACINASTSLYWIDGDAFFKIESYLNKLQPYELASIMYTNDLYHIRKLNNDFMLSLFDKLTTKVSKDYTDALSLIKDIPNSIINFAHQICLSEVRGIGKDYSKLEKDKLNTLLATCYNIIDTLNEYEDFFKTFFVTDDIPVSVAHIKSMIRKAVVLSDTDSTMFSSDDWVRWYYNGDLKFTDRGYAIAGVIGFITSQAIAHVLAIYSSNLGVAKDKIFKMEMKPEYVFPVFVQAPVAKHYFTCILMQEGNVFDKLDYEIKGVHLKNSALPREVIQASHSKMKEIIQIVINNEKISLTKELKEIIDLENTYRDNILNSKEYYYRKTTTKDALSYKLEEDKTPYWHYKLWTTVFSPTYGQISPPPYKSFILPLSINNKTDMVKWLASIENRELADRLLSFLTATNKPIIKTIHVSEEYVKAFGIPKEILSILDIKRIILDLTLSRRIIIDSLGFTPKTEMLFSEYINL